jgi:predicted component of type VI protein secretion system
MFRITVLRRGVPEQVFDLRDPLVRIGRGAGNEVLLRDPDKTVSRNHARIVRSGDGWVFLDNGSQNGSWVDGGPVDRVRLAGGMTIALGDYELRCESHSRTALSPDAETRLETGHVGARPPVSPPAPPGLAERQASLASRASPRVERHLVSAIADNATAPPEPSAPPAGADGDSLEPTRLGK